MMASNRVLTVMFVLSFYTILNLHAVQATKNVGIIGGHAVPIEKVPYMASLRLNSTFHYCGASIIHERFVLTAAHCIVPGWAYEVYVGTSRLNESREMYEIEKIIPHELYNNNTNDYDICLIKLKSNLTFSAKVNKIALADDNLKLKKSTKLDITGWGSTAVDSDISNDLLQVKIPIVPTWTCRFMYFKMFRDITKRMLCAGGPGGDTCQGDSGGPLTLENIQVGITSFGSECGNLPGVYTKVSALLPWIGKTIRQNL